MIAQHFTSFNIYEKLNKLVLIGSVYKRSEKQIKIVKNRYHRMQGNGVSITTDQLNAGFQKVI